MPAPYRLSLTAASLLPAYMAAIAQAYAEQDGDWAATRAYVLAHDLLQTDKTSTAKRRYQELELRLRALSEAQRERLAQAPASEQRLLSFVACCKSYPFLAGFVVEALLPKVRSHQLRLSPSDYHRYFEQEALRVPRLEDITDSTADKLRSRTLALVEEAGLLTGPEQVLTAPYLPAALARVLGRDAVYLLVDPVLASAP